MAISTTQIGLVWIDTSDNENEFIVERSTNSLFSGPTAIFMATVTPNTTSYSGTGLAPSKIYYFRVRARNAAGYSGYSNTANASTFTVSTLVGTPTTTASLSGSVDSIAGPGADARFNYPRGITITSGGTIYVADTMKWNRRSESGAG